MAVRTKRLAKAIVSSTTLTVIYTAPSDETVILKSINVGKFGVGTSALILLLRSAGVDFSLAFVNQSVSPSSAYLERWVVLQPGDEIVASVTGTQAEVWISGTELEGVAD